MHLLRFPFIIMQRQVLSYDKLFQNVCQFKIGQKKKKKRNTPIYINANYSTEMKLVLINMDYCLSLML